MRARAERPPRMPPAMGPARGTVCGFEVSIFGAVLDVGVEVSVVLSEAVVVADVVPVPPAVAMGTLEAMVVGASERVPETARVIVVDWDEADVTASRPKDTTGVKASVGWDVLVRVVLAEVTIWVMVSVWGTHRALGFEESHIPEMHGSCEQHPSYEPE